MVVLDVFLDMSSISEEILRLLILINVFKIQSKIAIALIVPIYVKFVKLVIS